MLDASNSFMETLYLFLPHLKSYKKDERFLFFVFYFILSQASKDCARSVWLELLPVISILDSKKQTTGSLAKTLVLVVRSCL